LRERRFEEALTHFEQASVMDPLNESAQVGANQALRALVPRWHFAMLNDAGRNRAFNRAIRAVVQPTTSLVLDIGAGSGLLAMIAARSGAKRVIACEATKPVAELAEAVVAANGLQQRIRILGQSSLELVVGRDIPHKADLLVTEVFDCGLLGESAIPTIRHARQSLLSEAATIIPRAGRVFAALLDSEQIHRLNHVRAASGFDVQLFNRFSTLRYFPVRLNTWRHRLLTRPQKIFSFDFQYGSLQPAQREIEFLATSSGRAHGVVFWFQLDLTDHITISNSPHNRTTHWMQAVQCFQSPTLVKAGQAIRGIASHDDMSIWFDLRSSCLQ
jgi:type II protein arginine methyltransferase